MMMHSQIWILYLIKKQQHSFYCMVCPVTAKYFFSHTFGHLFLLPHLFGPL